MNRHDFLAGLHDVLQPRTYLEIGVEDGRGLSLSRAPAIGIDPDYAIAHELHADVAVACTTSDEFFARPDPLAHLPLPVLDLAFIDGMHLAEYALRDYLAVERFTTAASVVVFDDMLPRNVDEAARRRHSQSWTGDVYKAAEALRELCPQLIVLDVDTQPTGTVVVLLPDAGRAGALAGYDDWLERAVTPDPQHVPERVLARTAAVDPAELLGSAGWSMLRRYRNDGVPDLATRARTAFADRVGSLS